MSDYQTEPIVLDPEPQPKPRHRKGTGRVAIAIYASVVAGFLGAVAAAPSDPTTPTASEQPKPRVTVTAEPLPAKTVEVPGPTKTVTETKTVKVTPASCAEAMRQADRIVEAFQWENGWIVRYLGAVSELDVAKMNDLNGEIGGKTDKYRGVIPAYQSPAAECLAAN